MGELYAFPQATQQMLDDVFFNAEQWLADEIVTEFARAEGAAHCVGTGVNQPKGFASYTTAATAMRRAPSARSSTSPPAPRARSRRSRAP
jgi:HK97 family phage major capsid protein